MSVSATAQLFNYRGPVKNAQDRRPKAWVFDAPVHLPFPNIPNIGAGVANTVVQQRIVLAQYCKIAKVAIALDTIDTIDGSESFNIVVGTGAYGTSQRNATGSYTLTGTPTDSDTNTYTIGGHAVHTNQATAHSLAQQAAADAASINDDATVGLLVHAEAVGASIYLEALANGAAGNGITTTGTSSAGDTVTANQASLAGGTDESGITLPVPDQFLTTGVHGPDAVDGMALFSPDVAFDTANFPGLTTGAGGSAVFVPPNNPLVTTSSGLELPVWDAVFAPGTRITVRVTTNAGDGAITNLLASLLVANISTQVNNQQGIPGVDW